MKRIGLLFSAILSFTNIYAQNSISQKEKSEILTAVSTLTLKNDVDKIADKIEPKVIAWRRDFHQNAELSNREFKTGEKIAAHLKSLGIETKTGVAKTGVVGILRGGKPGPVVALRADMDALPVVERVDLPFKCTTTTEYNGQKVGVMHACGHDSHVAMLMGAAEILVSMKKDLAGTVVFLFQPAEEGAPEGEEGGAPLMIKEGALDNPKVEVVFGLHINSQTEVGKIRYKPGATMASSDWFKIKVKGKQTHGSQPWGGIDPIVVSTQIIQGLQTIVSRQVNLTKAPAVITVGQINSGVRANIIPEETTMIGTIRTLDGDMQKDIHNRIRNTATNIAESAGATAIVEIDTKTLVTYNDPKTTEMMLPSLQSVAGKDNVMLGDWTTGAEDFSFYAQKCPTLFYFLGGMAKNAKPEEVFPHHTPDFRIDESSFKLGMRSLCYLTLDYMNQKTAK